MKRRKKVEFVEVVENKLIGEEPLDTLVRLPFIQLVGMGMEAFLQNLSVLAIGAADQGQFKINNMVVQLAGIVNEDILFNVKGILQTFNTEKKSLAKVEPKKSKKKNVKNKK